MAETAAPANITSRATIRVLTRAGFQVAREGQNGFVCEVMRGWSAPDLHAGTVPLVHLRRDHPRADLLRPVASRTVLPYYELRGKLGMEGKTPDQIGTGLAAAYSAGAFPGGTA